MILHGYSAGVRPETQQAHAKAAFAGIADVIFIVATRFHNGDPAVVVALNHQAATAFASRHMYGLMGPLDQGTLKWEQMTLRNAR